MLDVVLLAHGGGGLVARQLIEEHIVKALPPGSDALEDAAEITLPPGRVALTTDSYVVQPLVFPGGNIGKLAVCGTVNDLAMRGAMPLYLSTGFILEEGLSFEVLDLVVTSMAETAAQAGVRIVTGDTKVVGRGSADGIYINTAGVGVVSPQVAISVTGARPGDAVLINGSIGDHGMAIMTRRHGLEFESPIVSDCAPLNGLVAAILETCSSVHVLRDATRGGVAAVLNEVASASGVGIRVEEANLVIRDAVRGASELLGLDPLYVANEGKLVACVPGEAAGRVLDVMRAHPLGREATQIGEVTADSTGRVVMHTTLGTRRIIDMPAGELLPRIC